jgi:hypothetical protein
VNLGQGPAKQGEAHLSSEKGEATVITPFDSSCEVNSLFCFGDDLRDSSIKITNTLFSAVIYLHVNGYECVCVFTHGLAA